MVIILSDLIIVAAGLCTYSDIFSLLPIFGVIFETLGLWLKSEPKIRLVSFLGAPFWLVYNIVCLAYGSAVGNVITMVSIAVAIIRYDIIGKEK